MKDIIHITDELSTRLSELQYVQGDLSDIGNEIGIILGKYINKKEMGFELEDFITGLKHGISVTDGTHG
jgi:hypothetical protein